MPTKQGAPPAKRAKKKKAVWPWLTAASILLLGGGGFAAWKAGKLDQVIAKVKGPPKKRPATAEEMRRELAAKTMPATPASTPAGWNPSGPPASNLPTSPPPAPPAKAEAPAKPAEPTKPTPMPATSAVTANGLSGKVIDASESSSKKTRYLEIHIGGSSRWVAYDTKLNKPGLDMADLETFVGKNVTVTGQFKKELSHRGEVLHIGKREDIQVQP